MSPTYDTLTEALEALRQQGFVLDFNQRGHCLDCPEARLRLFPAEFDVVQVHRFEGQTNPDDSAVLYALQARKGGHKGVLVDAYGTYATALSPDMARKLRLRHG